MQIKSSGHRICGMNRDNSYSTFNPEFSWENKNIRLTARDGNDLLSITNEKGNSKIQLSTGIIGEPIGSCEINDKLVLFTTEPVVESASGLSIGVNNIVESAAKNTFDIVMTVDVDGNPTIIDWDFQFDVNIHTGSEDGPLTVLILDDCYNISDGTVVYNPELDITTFTRIYSFKFQDAIGNVYYSVANPKFVVIYNDGELHLDTYSLISYPTYESAKLHLDGSVVSDSYEFYNGNANVSSSSVVTEHIAKTNTVDSTATGDTFTITQSDYLAIDSSELVGAHAGSTFQIDVTLDISVIEEFDDDYNVICEWFDGAVWIPVVGPGLIYPGINNYSFADLDITKNHRISYEVTVSSTTINTANVNATLSVDAIYQKDIAPAFNLGNLTIVDNYSTSKIYSSEVSLLSTILNESKNYTFSFEYEDSNGDLILSSGQINSAAPSIIYSDPNSTFSMSDIKLFVDLVDYTPTGYDMFLNYSANDSYEILGSDIQYFSNESDGLSRIYRIDKTSDSSYSNTLLYSGRLGFIKSNKIQTLPFYENESIQKVYWIDGINQPRVINIINETYIGGNTNQFDFVQNLELNETAQIEKIYGTGLFKSGVIQYGATYFNKNGAESNLFWISDANYVSTDNRAGKVDEIIQNSFKISLGSLDSNFDYVRLYSIYRNSLDSTPEVKNIVDLKIRTDRTAVYIDGGTSGSIISSDFLLYVGGEELIPQCISQKNNTLFLGNILLKDNTIIPPTLQTNGDILATGVPVHTSTFTWQHNEVDFEGLSQPTGNSMYPYLPFHSNIKHFKFDETYRFGVQGQFANGKWSTPIWLGYDSKVNKRYSTYYDSNGRVKLSYITGKYSVSDSLRDHFKNKLGFSRVRPVMVPLNYSDRTIIAQGLVNNTLGIMHNRFGSNKSNLPFSYPDYSLRTNGKRKTSYANTDAYNGQYAHFDLLKLNNNLRPESGNTPNKWIEIMGNCNINDYHDVNDNGTTQVGTHPSTVMDGNFDRDFFFVDRNIVNFWSPDLINNPEQLNSYVKNVQSVGLYGFAFQTSLDSKFEIDFGDISNSISGSPLLDSQENYYSGSYFLNNRYSKVLFPNLPGSGSPNSYVYRSPISQAYPLYNNPVLWESTSVLYLNVLK